MLQESLDRSPLGVPRSWEFIPPLRPFTYCQFSDMHFETRSVHVGVDKDPAYKGVITPIYPTSTFVTISQ